MNRQLRQALTEKDGPDCRYCGAEGQEPDHVKPRIRGGQDTLDNLVLACRSCNRRKGRDGGFHLNSRRVLFYRNRRVAPDALWGEELMVQVEEVRLARQVKQGLAWAVEKSRRVRYTET